MLLPLRFRYRKHLLLPLRFRTEKTFIAATSLSHRKNICCCHFAFAQKKHLLLTLRFRYRKHLLLTLRFRTEQSFLGSSDEPLLVLLTLRFRTVKTFAAATLTLRFRTENIRCATGSRANTMLVTKALSQDVMLLAFVPLSLIPKESPSLHSNQLFT
ncbi:hypothetical protein [Lysinibacillus sp. NPDC096259]|uniref:hypothetical protein n=1 Tax=Lysinibacillus sp. NPDC096259 TaxID=3390583 RepID=UPI003D01607D